MHVRNFLILIFSAAVGNQDADDEKDAQYQTDLNGKCIASGHVKQVADAGRCQCVGDGADKGNSRINMCESFDTE